MLILIINGVSIFLAMLVGLIQNLPTASLKDDYKFGDNYGLAIQTIDNEKDQFFDITYDVTTTQPQYYQKFNDEAVVFWTGGPILNKKWKTLTEQFLWAFSKDWRSKTPDGKLVEGNASVDIDLYWGVQNQWEGINLHKYFGEPLSTSGVSNFGFETIFRPLNYADSQFIKTYDSTKYENKVKEMMQSQTKWMLQLAGDLKKIGYKKVHYLGFSFGSFLTNYFIKEYGDEAFKNVDTITSVATRVKFDQIDIKENSKKNKFPFKIYNPKTKKYDKTYLYDIKENAATLGVILPIFRYLIKIDYSYHLKRLAYENKTKFTLVSTPYDFRVGSLSQDEKNLRNFDINILEIPSHKITKYQQLYLSPYKRDIDQNFKTGFIGGINHHDVLLNYFLHNFKGLYNKDFSNEYLIRDRDSYFCIINSDVIKDCEKDS